MVNADKGVLYKGLPQDDWQNKPKVSRITSTGPLLPSNPSGNNAKKKSCTKVFLTIVFFLCILTVLGVISFRIYETPPKGLLDFWGPITDKPNDQNNVSSTSSNETLFPSETESMGNQSTALQNISNNEAEEKEPTTSTQMPSFANLSLINQTTTNLDSPSLGSSEMPTGVGMTSGPTNIENETTTKDLTPEFSEVTTQPPALWPIPIGTSTGGSSASSAIMNHTTNSSKTEPQNESSLSNGSSLFSEILHEYFNASSPKEEQIRQWLEHLLSKPSLEVTMIAAGIIFAGVSLLVMGVVCAIGQRNRRRRRRHRLNRTKEGNRIEKVILLADDASEDEFTKT